MIRLDELVGSIGGELREQNLDVTETAVAPVEVRANRLALNRALRNLIINAATHGVRARVGVPVHPGEHLRTVRVEGCALQRDRHRLRGRLRVVTRGVQHRRDREAALADCIGRYSQRLEDMARTAPLQWFNFFDFWEDREKP